MLFFVSNTTGYWPVEAQAPGYAAALEPTGNMAGRVGR